MARWDSSYDIYSDTPLEERRAFAGRMADIESEVGDRERLRKRAAAEMERANPRQLDTFARHLLDVRRGLVAIGWDDSRAKEFVQGLNENRYEVIKLRKKAEVLEGLVKGNALQVV
jgi:hypothetical protein